MDSFTKSKKVGEPFEPVPPHRWTKNVISSEDDNSPYSFTSEDGDDECSSGAVSSDENVSVVNTNNSPKSKKKTTVSKSSWKAPPNQQNASRMGEKTPHTTESTKTVSSVQVNSDVALRVKAAATPQSIRVRDVPLPALSWTDSSDLSQLLCYKEEISKNERYAYVFRKDPNLNNRMRAILFDWLMEVCDVYKLRRVTYYLAIDYIDRYLSKTEMVKKNHLQLLGITCLFIAAKVEEIYPPKLAELAYVTDGACTETDMLEKEMEILGELQWDVNPITVTGWLYLYLQLACTKANESREMMRKLNSKDDDIIYPQFSPHFFMTGCMLADLCSLDDGMMYFKYSVIAASVVYYILTRETALFVSGYTWNNISRCVEWMDPFALVVFRTLTVKPLILPSEYQRNDSALRVTNPSIVLEDEHTLQNHAVDLALLEEVRNEIKIMRHNYITGKTTEKTGWTVSPEGFDQFDNNYTADHNSKRKVKRKNDRFCFLPDASKKSGNIDEKSAEKTSKTIDGTDEIPQSKEDRSSESSASDGTNDKKYNSKCNSEKNINSSKTRSEGDYSKQNESNEHNLNTNNKSSKSNLNENRGKKRRRNSDAN